MAHGVIAVQRSGIFYIGAGACGVFEYAPVVLVYVWEDA
jgi:hypothetical protein